MLHYAIGITVLLQGGWMVFDGLHVLLRGRYFGPAAPGPWQRLVRAVGLEPQSLGLPFVLLGGLWLIGGGMVLEGQDWAWSLALGVAIASLWYLPVGTLLSLLMIGLLLYGHDSLVR